MHGRRDWLLSALFIVVFGMIGMGLFRAAETLYTDWSFLHQSRLNFELQLQQQQQKANTPVVGSATQTK